MERYTSDEIYKVLEGEIISLHIPPFETLSENALCVRFNVSRTVVRSALQRLELAGFVEIIPHVGTKVTGINLDAVMQFIYLRVSAETAVLTDFLKTATPIQREELRYRKEEFEKTVSKIDDFSSLDPKNTHSLLATDLEFHHSYFRFQGKEMLWGFLTQPHPNYSRFIRLDMMGGKNLPDVLREHSELMEIIDKGAADQVNDVISRHLNGGARRLGAKLFTEEFQQYIETSPKTDSAYAGYRSGSVF